MAYFEFPHSRSYEGDLGYIIKTLDALVKKYNTFFDYNSIHFADPIEWDITKQYAAFTIVFDMDNQVSMISKQPVPAGITLDNSDFWSFVGPLIVDGEARVKIERILHFITNVYESTDEATVLVNAGTYLIIEGELYKATQTINIGEHYTVGYNIAKITIEDMVAEIVVKVRPIDIALDPLSTNAISNKAVADKFLSTDSKVSTLESDVATFDGRITNLNNLLTAETITRANADTALAGSIQNVANDLVAEETARTLADSTLTARMDTFASLPAGSTAGNAELLDIRVGYDGVTYPSAGAATRWQPNKINGKLEQDFTTMTTVPNQWTVVYFPIIKGRTYTVTNNSTSTMALRLVDKYLNNHDIATVNANISYNCTADDKYVQVRGWFNVAGTMNIKGNTTVYDDISLLFDSANAANAVLNPLADMIIPILNMFDESGTYTPVVSGKYVDYSSGTEYTNASYQYAKIPVEGDTVYSVNTANAHLAFFNSANTYISGYLVPGGVSKYTFTTPSGAAYCTFSITNTQAPTAMFVKGDKAAVYEPFALGINEEYIAGSVLRVGPNRQYTSIQAAIENANDNDTIIIDAGTYTEELDIQHTGKFLHLIGAGTDAPIVTTTGGGYDHPALEVGIGLIENMSFITTATAPDPGESICSYAVHIDYDIEANKSLQFNNCKFITASQPAVGIGLRENFTLTFNNCYFEAVAAAFYCHDQQASNKLNQNVILNDCTINCVGSGSPAIQLQETRSYTGNECTARFQRCIAKRANPANPVIAMKEYPDDETPAGSNYLNSYSWYLDPLSALNNESILDD